MSSLKQDVIHDPEVTQVTVPREVGIGIVITPHGPLVRLRFDDHTFAVTMEAWNELILGLREVSEQVGIGSRISAAVEALQQAPAAPTQAEQIAEEQARKAGAFVPPLRRGYTN